MDRSRMSRRARRYKWGLGLFIALSFFCSSVLYQSHTATAAVPAKMNFQGRLTNSAGNIMADGQYNMTFRLFTASSGGSAVWTEVRETTDRVTVTNGLFSVRLGDVTTIPASLFASGSLYLEIEMPTPATVTCSTASCASYTGADIMSPRSEMATSAYAFNSDTLDGQDSSAFTQLSGANTFTNTNLFKNTSNSTSAFGVQNAGSGSLLNIDTTGPGVVTLLGNNSGEAGAWSTASNAMPAGLGDHTSVTANGYVYAIGGGSAIYYAKLNADGSVGTWTTASNPLAVARFGATAAVANGYLYVLGGVGTETTVSSAKLNADGSVGTWADSANTIPDTGRSDHTSAVANGYLYVMGGSKPSVGVQQTVYYSKLNPDGSIGSWTTAANALPIDGRYRATSVVANGYVYVMGGPNNGVGVSYAKLNIDGSVGAWTNDADTLPGVREDATSVVSNGYVYVMGGTTNGTAGQSTVYYARLNNDGSVGAWATAANPLTAARCRATSVIANGYAYVIGGNPGSSSDCGNTANQTTVYYARMGGTVQIGGNLDLVGLQGQNLADGGSGYTGSAGGSITAGNITGVGTLQIQGAATFNDSASISGTLAVGGNVTIGGSATSSLGKLYVPWQSGDTIAAIYGGASSGSNNQIGVYGRSGSGTGVQGVSGTGTGVQGSSTSNVGVAGTSVSSIGVQGRSDTSTSGLFVSTNTAGTNSSTTLVTRASTAQVGDLFQAQDSSNASLFKIKVDGVVNSKVGADNAAGFVVQDAGGNEMLTADSVNDRIYIGDTTADSTGVILVLDTKNSAGDPTGVNGGTYYNSNLGKFRCYEASEWRDCMDDPMNAYAYTNDFISAVADTTLLTGTSGGSVNLVASDLKHPGVVEMRTGTTTSGRAGYLSGGGGSASEITPFGNSTTWSYKTAIKITNLSDATDTYTYRTGFIDIISGETTDGCFFRYTHSVNSGKYEGVCRNNNTESVCDTGITATASVWARMQVVVLSDGSSANFSINGASACSVTTNIPTASSRRTGFGTFIFKSAGTTSYVIAVDYISVRGSGTGLSRD